MEGESLATPDRIRVQRKQESAYKPGFVIDSHSSGTHITVRLKQPTRIQCGSHLLDPYLVLLRVGFTMPWNVATHAVRSYRTLSPLPLSEDT